MTHAQGANDRVASLFRARSPGVDLGIFQVAASAPNATASSSDEPPDRGRAPDISTLS